MNTRRNLLYLGITMLLAIVGTAVFLYPGIGNGKTNTSIAPSQEAVTQTDENLNAKYDRYGLATASDEKVAQYAVSYLKATGQLSKGEPQILMSRRVTRHDVGLLGLGCMGDFGTIEEPPLSLVILKGHFDSRMEGNTESDLDSIHYIALVFDLWAGEASYTLTSKDGTGFRVALKDESLPSDEAFQSEDCPTPATSTKNRHYGDTAPGFIYAPTLPPEIQSTVVGGTPTPINILTPFPTPDPSTPVVPFPLSTIPYPTIPPSP